MHFRFIPSSFLKIFLLPFFFLSFVFSVIFVLKFVFPFLVRSYKGLQQFVNKKNSSQPCIRRKVKVRKTDKGLEFFAQNSILTLVFVHDLSWEQLLLGGWGAPCCGALKVMTHFTLSCDGSESESELYVYSSLMSQQIQLNLICYGITSKLLYHLLGF